MVPLFLKLLTAHLAGDYLVQTSRIATEKVKPRWLALHILAHTALLVLVALTEPRTAALGVALLFVLLSHAAIDGWTSRISQRTLGVLALDQGLHIGALVIAVVIAGGASDAQLLQTLGQSTRDTQVWIVGCGALLAIPAGATIVGRAIGRFRDALSNESASQRAGLDLAGRWIGMLERAIVYIAVLASIESLIGFVIAVKAVLRLPEAREKWSREIAEYYLLGSLASLGWGLLVALSARGLARLSH